jgi:hypothetical protein
MSLLTKIYEAQNLIPGETSRKEAPNDRVNILKTQVAPSPKKKRKSTDKPVLMTAENPASDKSFRFPGGSYSSTSLGDYSTVIGGPVDKGSQASPWA